MTVLTEYRLPGVYSTENTSQMYASNTGGNAVVALIGPALGRLSASQRITLYGSTAKQLANANVQSGSYSAVNVNTGMELAYNTNDDGDYSSTVDAQGKSSISRHVRKTSVTKTDVSGLSFVFTVANPVFSILNSAAQAAGGNAIKGTVTVAGSSLVETIGTVAAEDEFVLSHGSGTVSTVTVKSGSTTLTANTNYTYANNTVTFVTPHSNVTFTYTPVYVEGTDYVIDYYKSTLAPKSGGKLVNGDALTIGYGWTTAEPIELVGDAAAALQKRYISQNGLTATTSADIVCCTYNDGTAHTYGEHPGKSGTDKYVEGVDFIVDYVNGKIARTANSAIPTFSETAGNLMYVAYGYCGIREGDAIVVTYDYVPSDYNSPKYFASYNEFAAYFGNGWASDGSINSPLTVAAYLANKNGLGGCYGVAVRGTTIGTGAGSSTTYTLEAWSDAFDALEDIDGIDIVVPLSGDSAVWSLAQSHVETMKENEDERVAIIGADGTSSVIQPSSLISMAEAIDNEDIWMIAPSTFKVRNVINGLVDVMPAYYVAANIAGYLSSVPQYTPLTQKVVSGLYSANEYYSKVVKTNECANGLMYVDETRNGMRILHGRTTCTDSVIQQESNIILAKYYIIKTIRRMFESGYVGSIINSETLASVKAAAYAKLNDLVNGNFMTGFTGPDVSVSQTNPTQVNVSFSYKPTYSMNYIDITFSIDTTVE